MRADRRTFRGVISFVALLTTFGLVQASVTFSLDSRRGEFTISDSESGFTLHSAIGNPCTDAKVSEGRDSIGSFEQTTFLLGGDADLRATVWCYRNAPVCRFRLRYGRPQTGGGIPFPNFDSLPANLHTFSFEDRTFAPPTYSLAQTSTPWLFFNDRAQSFILSPAAHFLQAKMVTDESHSIGVRFNNRLNLVPANTEQESVLVFSSGIGKAWNAWGDALRKLNRRPNVPNDADQFLKYFGYWTDNGADYYYNYDTSLGYADTLLKLRDRYREEGIPLGYMQLDSWWYQKTTDDADGRPGGATKNAALPAGTWNRYGGTWEYRASPDLFATGLPDFQQKLGLPLVVHGRWLDRKSPYHTSYRISGVGAIDPKWWNDVAEYLKTSGVGCYEQDWLDHIFNYSPEMISTFGIADQFTDSMAAACRHYGLDMQYCMATPRFFLQGVKYPNLTTIRTSDDRFEPRKWESFLYDSQLARCSGIWPWCDVFKSAETSNMILAVLSAGPVGTGDSMGRESKANILRAARPDGVIVKPDEAAVPTDATYLDQASGGHRPFTATTYTDHHGIVTRYLFTLSNSGEPFISNAKDFGLSVPGTVYLIAGGAVYRLEGEGPLVKRPPQPNFSYAMFAPQLPCGITILGDLSKFVPTGKQRIADIDSKPDSVTIKVSFAKGEGEVQIDGVSPNPPTVTALQGAATLKSYDEFTHHFQISVAPAPNGQATFKVK